MCVRVCLCVGESFFLGLRAQGSGNKKGVAPVLVLIVAVPASCKPSRRVVQETHAGKPHLLHLQHTGWKQAKRQREREREREGERVWYELNVFTLALLASPDHFPDAELEKARAKPTLGMALRRPFREQSDPSYLPIF